jgi:hypothetical protein
VREPPMQKWDRKCDLRRLITIEDLYVLYCSMRGDNDRELDESVSQPIFQFAYKFLLPPSF